MCVVRHAELNTSVFRPTDSSAADLQLADGRRSGQSLPKTKSHLIYVVRDPIIKIPRLESVFVVDSLLRAGNRIKATSFFNHQFSTLDLFEQDA